MAKKKTYKYGQDELDMEKYLHNLGQNVQSYIASLNWTPEQIQEFLNSYNQYMNAFKDLMTNDTQRFSTNDFGDISDSDGKFSNKDEGDEYYYDDKGKRITLEEYDKLKDSSSKGLFKKKSNHKDAYKTFQGNQQVAIYFNKIAHDLRDKLSITALPKTKFTTDLWGKSFLDTFLPGLSTPEWESLINDDKFENGVRGRTVRSGKLADFNDKRIKDLEEGNYDFEGSPFKDKETARAAYQEFSDALRSGDYNRMEDAARNAGIDLVWFRKYMTDKEHVTDDTLSNEKSLEQIINEARQAGIAAGFTGEALDLYVKLKLQNDQILQELALLQMKELNNEFNKLKWINSLNPFEDVLYGGSYSGHSWNDRLKGVGRNFYLGYSKLSDPEGQKQYLSQQLSAQNLQNSNLYWDNIAKLSYWVDGKDLFKIDGTDQYYLPWTVNEGDNSVFTYDRKLRTIKKRFLPSLLNLSILKGLEKNWNPNNIYDFWGGGPGSMTDVGTNAAIALARGLRNKKEAHNIISKLYDLQTGRDKDRQLAGRREVALNMKAEDFMRLGAIGADIASTIMSFVPGYGTAGSLVTGIGATATNFAADALDSSIGWGTALKNAGYGLSMDLLGAIPGSGSVAKAGKIGKTVKTIAPMVLGIWMSMDNMGEATTALKKLISSDNADKMTVDDWRALAHGFTAIAGLTRGGVSGYRNMKGVTKDTAQSVKSSVKSWKDRLTPKRFKKQKTKHDNSIRHTPISDDVMFNRKMTPDLAQLFADWDAYYMKKGGIAKLRVMANGGQIPVFQEGGTPGTYRKLSDLKQFDKNNYTADWDLENLYSGDTSNGLQDAYVSNVVGIDPLRYAPSSVNNREYAQQVQLLAYYKWFDLALKDNELVRNAWTRLTDAQLPENSRARFWSADGKQNNPWAPKNNDVYGRTAQGPYSDMNDYIQHTRYDDVIGARHNVLARRGKRYFYKNDKGEQVWVNPEDINGFDVSEKAANSSWDNDKMVLWDDYELKEKTPASQTTVFSDPKAKNLDKNKDMWYNLLGNIEIDPNLHALGRAIYADKENRKMTNMAINNERVLLKDPMEIHRRLFGNLRALTESLNRQGLNSHIAGIATGSDLAVQNLKQLENTVQNNAIDALAKAIDDEMQRTTGEKAFAQEKENLANRHETAMFNRLSLLLTMYNKGMHELAYRNKKHEIWDTLWKLHEYEGRMKQEQLKDIKYQLARVLGMQDLISNPEKYGFTSEEAELIKLSQTTPYSKMTPELQKAVDNLRYKYQNAQLQIDADARSLSLNSSWLRGLSQMIKNDPAKAVGSEWNAQMFLLPTKNAKGGKLKDGDKIKVAKIRERIKNADRFDKGIWTKRKLSLKDIERISKSLYGYPKLK